MLLVLFWITSSRNSNSRKVIIVGVVTEMKYWIVFWMVLAAITPLVVAEETLENVRPGATSVDLGDGYEISLELDDSFGMYDITPWPPSESVMGKG